VVDLLYPTVERGCGEIFPGPTEVFTNKGVIGEGKGSSSRYLQSGKVLTLQRSTSSKLYC